MDDVLAIILGGGRGTRLLPLTLKRSKPAVPLGGKYRLIDIPSLPNAGHAANLRADAVPLGEPEPARRDTYKFDVFSRLRQVLAAEQTEEGGNWFQGTADAVRQSLRHMRRTPARDILILSGNQLYSMDYAQMLETHRESNADATVAVIPVAEEQTSAFGILKMDNTGRIVHFDEKPPPNGCPGWRPSCRAAAPATSPRWASTSSSARSWSRRSPTRSSSTSGATSSPTRSRASACRRTSTAATGRTWGRSSPTFRRTSRCANRSRRLISTTPSAPSTRTRASWPPRSWSNATSTDALICEGCIIHGSGIDRAVIGIRSRIGRCQDPQQPSHSAPTSTRPSRRCGRPRRAASRRSASAPARHP